jgi:Ferritin-like
MVPASAATAEEEAPMVIKTREELIFLLSEAAALEHMVLCGYLFAAFTIKDRRDEVLTPRQFDAVSRWERVIRGVAAQEMLHLSLVNNLLTAVGAAPYFGHPNFPHPAKYFAPRVQLALIPFGERALRHFLYLERPESFDLDDAEGFEVSRLAVPNTVVGDEIVPEVQTFATVGHLYRGIENGFVSLVRELGERRVFVGPPHCQATSECFAWPELVRVTDIATAKKAIETIITEGEGARGHWKRAHFGKFYQVLNEYIAFRREDPSFEPARPAIPASTRQPADVSTTIARITDPLTGAVADLFNASYTLTLQMLSRYFMHTESSAGELQTLSNSSVDMMTQVLDPLGKRLTQLPIGDNHPGCTAGPSFEVYRMEYLLPHRHAAWVLFHERLTELDSYCGRLASKEAVPPGLELGPIKDALEKLSATMEPHAHSGTPAW